MTRFQKYLSFSLLAVIILFNTVTAKTKYEVQQLTDKNGYKYETVTNDPTNLRIYTLKNGLKVYLSVNKDEPRIQTFIGVKAGSTFDPSETTGLAHYLEHLMFKGSSSYGTADWEKERPYIEELSNLFEQHRRENNPEIKKVIYSKIDSISQIAAKYAVANEYDKMMTSIGAKGTNANTSEERTVYVNNIPANELEKWLKLESNRFSSLVLRLFHTELETVYEEFNMYQDMDAAKVEEALVRGIFKKHPYGTQTTIGKPEHLKNPSMVNIMNYWHQYYVPNNMAICLSGDLDFDETIAMIDKYWGDMKPGNPPKFIPPVEEPITKPETIEVMGPNVAFVQFGFRFNGLKSEDYKFVTLIDMILSNSKAGLIDLDLVQKQKILEGGSNPDFRIDYGIHAFNGTPRQGQTLEEVRDLLLAEIEKVKKGDFDDWLIEAVINDMRLSRIRSEEGSRRASIFVESFAQGQKWQDYLNFLDDLEKITKPQIVDFANKYYKNNFVVVFKRTGKDVHVVKVEKPKITSLNMNRNLQSQFFKDWAGVKSNRLSPVFVDYSKDITKDQLKNGIELNYIKNVTNDIFSINYIFDMGKDNNPELPIAVEYLPYLGTDKYSPAELQKEFFKYGLSFSVNSGSDRSYVTVSGLTKNMDKGVELLEHLLSHVKSDQDVYNDYIKGIIKQRADAKLEKNTILWGGLFNYGMYGKSSSFSNVISEEDLKNIDPIGLTELIKHLTAFKHKVFYYGPSQIDDVKILVDKYHRTPSILHDCPPVQKYEERKTTKNEVFFVDFDNVQSSIIMMSPDQKYDKTLIPTARLFNEYFGGSMSSIVFQEIREAKGLAYTAFAAFTTPSKIDKSHFTYAFVGTQSDKIKAATGAMLDLMNNMPRAEKSFVSSKDAVMKKIESERIIKSSVFWNYLYANDVGLNYDIRMDVYEKAKTSSLDDLASFFDKHIKDKKYTYLIVGKKDAIDWKTLEQLGEVKELTLQEIFGY
jgi:zinc protease